MSDTISSAQHSGAASAASGTRAAAALAILFGLAIVYVVGFAQPAMLHNAAHDARHAFTVPCH